ncbi:MAG: hypothetical protein QXS20_00140 [Candidatus Thorarchaeota archaeon]
MVAGIILILVGLGLVMISVSTGGGVLIIFPFVLPVEGMLPVSLALLTFLVLVCVVLVWVRSWGIFPVETQTHSRCGSCGMRFYEPDARFCPYCGEPVQDQVWGNE